MFARRLTLALAALSGAAVIQGLVGAWALSVANEHVQRGRVVSDIELAFKGLTVTKLRLRDWYIQVQLGLAPPAELRTKYQSDMRADLAQLRGLAASAVALDAQDATREEHVQRSDALTVLADNLQALEAAAPPAPDLRAAADARAAWLAAGHLFDVTRGRDLRTLLAESVQREAAAVARERAAADRALKLMRGLWLGAAGCIALAALALGVAFTRALRRPLDELNTGALALQRGQLAHRIPLEGRDEFSAVARSMNTMAVELAEHRARESHARQQLEALVDARTGELQRALEALQLVDARRRRLFADISHELRTPTTAILGEAEITLRGSQRPAADYQQALQRIVATARQLGAVIDDLLSVARSDIDALALTRHPLDLAEPLQQAVQQAAAIADEHGVKVRLAPLPAGGSPLLADPQRLRQLLMVMLDNAVQYSRPGGLVQVTVTHTDDAETGPGCVVSIADEGIGIAEGDLPQVFDRQYRSDQARQHRRDGSGLGLSIGRALARAHDGDIHISSQLGCGTTVQLHLPLFRSPT